MASCLSFQIMIFFRDLTSPCSYCLLWKQHWEGDWVKLETSWSSKIFPTLPNYQMQSNATEERQEAKIGTDTIWISQFPAHPDFSLTPSPNVNQTHGTRLLLHCELPVQPKLSSRCSLRPLTGAGRGAEAAVAPHY